MVIRYMLQLQAKCHSLYLVQLVCKVTDLGESSARGSRNLWLHFIVSPHIHILD